MSEEKIVDGETPFNAIERYRLRQLMKNLETLEPGDVVEIKKIAQSGRVMKGALVFISWFLGAVTGALLLFDAAKKFLGKV